MYQIKNLIKCEFAEYFTLISTNRSRVIVKRMTYKCRWKNFNHTLKDVNLSKPTN